MTEKENVNAKRGVDEPIPQRRGNKAEVNQSVDELRQAGTERALFQNVSLLDHKFPHTLRRQNAYGFEC